MLRAYVELDPASDLRPGLCDISTTDEPSDFNHSAFATVGAETVAQRTKRHQVGRV